MKINFLRKATAFTIAIVIFLGTMAISPEGILPQFGIVASAEETEIIKISTPEDLNAIRNNLSGNYRLMQDIDMSSWSTWEPIGGDNPFNGILDGNGYAIKNLTINTNQVRYCGLFGIVNGGTIKNLGLENINISSSYASTDTSTEKILSFTAGITGGLENSGKIERCYVTGKITANDYDNSGCRVAGIVGITGSGASISNCYANVELSGTSEGFNTMVGGIVAWLDSGCSVDNSYAAGTIYGKNIGRCYTGGIAASGLNGTINRCAALQDSINAKGGTVTNSVICTFAKCNNCVYLYGMSGNVVTRYYLWADDFSYNCNFPCGSISSEDAKKQDVYENELYWDFNNIWVMMSDDYPKLQKCQQQETPEEPEKYKDYRIYIDYPFALEGLIVGTDKKVQAKLYDGNTDITDKANFEWTLDCDPGIALIIPNNNSLLIRGLAIGTATITCKDIVSGISISENFLIHSDPTAAVDISVLNYETDSDGDGLPDMWEMYGITYKDEFLDLPAMGADPFKTDIFVEVDWMKGFNRKDYSEALRIVSLQFAQKGHGFDYDNDGIGDGINLHIDAGKDSIDYVTGRKWDILSAATEINFVENLDKYNMEDLVNSYFNDRKARPSIFRYCLMGNKVEETLTGYAMRNSKQIYRPEQYFFIGYGAISSSTSGQELTIATAGTFMHELGHTLGLKHSGYNIKGKGKNEKSKYSLFDDHSYNYKPNYLSIMNYLYQVFGLNAGIDPSINVLSDDDYLRLINYQEFDLPVLDENNLDENAGIYSDSANKVGNDLSISWLNNRNFGYNRNTWRFDYYDKIVNQKIDYNGDGYFHSSIQFDLDKNGEFNFYDETTNDWNHLNYRCGVVGKGAELDKYFDDYENDRVTLVSEYDEEDPINEFVERLYLNILNRPSDPSKVTHIDNLNNGESACKVAFDFVFSSEFAELPISNEERVRRMYLTFLNREADPAGLADWTAVLDNGCSIGHIFYGFTQSNEFTEICEAYGINRGTWDYTENRDRSSKLTAFVSRLYTKAMGRAYDVNGLNDHTGNYLENRDLYQLAYNFIFSSEFIEKNLTNEEFVDVMYRTFFDREADPAGKADWLDRMANQGYTREDVLAGFVGSQECINLVARFGI